MKMAMPLTGICTLKPTNLISLLAVLLLCGSVHAQKSAPAYSMVYYHLTPDEAQARRMLASIREMGATRVHALVYWWQAETLGGDYWKKDYSPEFIGEGHYKSLDLFVSISREMGMTPSLRLGSSREWNGLWHPADPSGSIEPYAKWVTTLAERYRGKIDHYVIGDEENQRWSAKEYFDNMFAPLAKAIRAGDPAAKISACATSSSPLTQWQLELIRLGLPKLGDGVACNFWSMQIDDLTELLDMMKQVRNVWPKAKFYSNGMGYAENRGLDDQYQAAIVAQCMFNLWDVGWESAPYYLYGFSITADTRQNYGLVELPTADKPIVVSAAWRAYQTIAHTFIDRTAMKDSKLKITVSPAIEAKAEDGTLLKLSPPGVYVRAFERGDELVLYLAYRNVRTPRDGVVAVEISSDAWREPQLVPLLDYTARKPVEMSVVDGRVRLVDVPVSLQPTIIILRRAK